MKAEYTLYWHPNILAMQPDCYYISVNYLV